MSLTRDRLLAMKASVEARRDMKHSPGLSCSDVLALIDAALRLEIITSTSEHCAERDADAQRWLKELETP